MKDLKSTELEDPAAAPATEAVGNILNQKS